MPDEKRITSKHRIVMEKRENIEITGVLDVISFDEETIIVDTEMGVLIMRGAGLHVNKLSLEAGELEVDGEIVSLNYEDQTGYKKGKAGSLFGKMFR